MRLASFFALSLSLTALVAGCATAAEEENEASEGDLSFFGPKLEAGTFKLYAPTEAPRACDRFTSLTIEKNGTTKLEERQSGACSGAVAAAPRTYKVEKTKDLAECGALLEGKNASGSIAIEDRRGCRVMPSTKEPTAYLEVTEKTGGGTRASMTYDENLDAHIYDFNDPKFSLEGKLVRSGNGHAIEVAGKRQNVTLTRRQTLLFASGRKAWLQGREVKSASGATELLVTDFLMCPPSGQQARCGDDNGLSNAPAVCQAEQWWIDDSCAP